MNRWQMAILLELFCLGLLGSVWHTQHATQAVTAEESGQESQQDFIQWVDFNVSYEALCGAYQWDVDTYGSAHHVNWIELLAYLAARYGDDFGTGTLEHLAKAAGELAEGETTIEELTGQLSYYQYYKEAYTAVLGGMVGEFEEETEPGSGIYKKKYGLKAYLPLAKGFPYEEYDDFGASRSYGYQRQHLGHDMLGQIGTPIIAVESGYVEAIGWNQYGGWRLGIRSFDGKRYYYYAHLRQNYPYAEGIEEGSVVTAGDVIGYMGHTGYSTTENVNNISVVHLHFGIQLIFDESQKEGNSEIWIDPYQLVRFLANHQSQTEKVEGTTEWIRTQKLKDPAVTSWERRLNMEQ